MRAFLSHSSSNKNFVRPVFEGLGVANAEFDEQTFEAGKFNTEAILRGLKRCDIFVLFATPESLSSGYVGYEIDYASEYYAEKKIRRIVTFCLDGVSPRDLPSSLQGISAIRRTVSVGAAIRLIKAELIELEIATSSIQRPYLGRDQLAQEIKAALAAPDEPIPVAIALSGVDGIGRRTLANRVLADVYPGTGRIHPAISIGATYDARDVHRALLDVGGGLSKAEIFEHISAFDVLDLDEKIDAICLNIMSLSRQNEILYIIDNGGVLDEKGQFSDTLSKIIEVLERQSRTIPSIVFVLFRTPPILFRRKTGVYYFRVDPLEQDDVGNLVSLHIKNKGQSATKDEVKRIVDLIDGHPYNLQFLLRLLDTYSIQSLIGDPADLLAFKRRQGDEFVSKIDLKENHFSVLGALRTLGQCSLEMLSAVIPSRTEYLARTLKDLEEFHCIERVGNLCSINRPLMAAFERSTSLRLGADQIERIQEKAIEVFRSYRDDDQINIEVISAAARAAVFLNKDDESLRLFLTPANSVMVARQLYDLRRFPDCARVCETALRSYRLISERALVEVIRLRCLSLARMGEDLLFEETLGRLTVATASHRALKFFLEGFHFRLNGDPDRAIEKFKQSLSLNANSFSTLRELSHCLMTIGDVAEAKEFAEKALEIAPTNPYVIDQVLALRVSEKPRVDRDIVYDPEIRELLDRLERYGDEEGKSFFAIRMADILRRAGQDDEALDHARRAEALTPALVPAYIVGAEILLKKKKFKIAEAKIESIRRIIEDKKTGEGRSRLPDYIALRVGLLIETEKFDDAASLARSHERRLARRVPDFKRRIAHAADRAGVRLKPETTQWVISR